MDNGNRDQKPQDHLASEKIQVERKLFFFDLKENSQGRFLRITEDVNGRRNTIIVPSTGLEDFRHALDQVISAHHESGPVATPPSA